VWRIHSHGGPPLVVSRKRCLCVYRHHASGKEIGVFLLFAGFGLKICHKAVHNLKTKFGHHAHNMGNVCANFRIFNILVSEVAWRIICSFLADIFVQILHN